MKVIIFCYGDWSKESFKSSVKRLSMQEGRVFGTKSQLSGNLRDLKQRKGMEYRIEVDVLQYKATNVHVCILPTF